MRGFRHQIICLPDYCLTELNTSQTYDPIIIPSLIIIAPFMSERRDMQERN